MVTSAEIALRAGVSRGTVDRVLHNRGKVSPEKEALVRQIASELGYVPNLAGRGLAVRKKSLRIGMLYPKDDRMTPFFKKVVAGAQEYAESLSAYNAAAVFLPRNGAVPAKEEEIRSMIEDAGLDAIAFDGETAMNCRQLLKELKEKGVPFVLYNSDLQIDGQLAYIGCDYEKAGRIACGLAAMGRKEKICVGIASHDFGNVVSSSARIRGFEDEMRRFPDMSVSFRQFMSADLNQDEFFEHVRSRVQEHPEVNVMYVVNPGDYSICRLIHDIRRDIAIITNDLIDEHQRQMIQSGEIAATICQQPEVQGAKSLEILFRHLAFGEKPQSDWFRTRLSIIIAQNADEEI